MSNVIPQIEPSKPYWIIVSDEGHASVPYRHDTEQSAYDESIRLAKIKPEVKFSIFKYVGHSFAEKPKVTFHTYREQPVIPTWNVYQPRWGFALAEKDDIPF